MLSKSEEEQREGFLEANLAEEDIGQSKLSPTIRQVLSVEEDGFKTSVGSWYLFLLTCCLGGFQVIWTVILANGSPFLTSIGLSKSLTALVWIAAPLCGTVAQPLIGSLGDRSQNRFGRRRPFILGGSIGIAISVLSLAWTPELVRSSLVRSSTGGVDSATSHSFAIFLAIFWIYTLNVSIQIVQSGSRALIIEACPTHQQEQASAWASITAGGWNIFGYLCGFTALPELLSTHLSQFQCLSLIASVSMICTALVTCISIHEPSTARAATSSATASKGIFTIIRDLSRTYRLMPTKVRRVCYIQFWAWMGRFPFLFYSTTYVAEFYRDQVTSSDPPSSSSSPGSNPLTPDAIRHGTFANFLFAIIAFLASVCLPYFLSLSQSPSHAKATVPSWLSIARVWSLSHLLWALIMFSTFFVTNPATATILVASLGLSWAVSQWAPFAVIGREIAASANWRQQGVQYGDDDDEDDGDQITAIRDEATSTTTTAASDIQAAAIMGIHNAAISAPQVVAALLCSLVFWLVKVMGWGNGTAWVMRVGGIAALGAGWLSWGSDI